MFLLALLACADPTPLNLADPLNPGECFYYLTDETPTGPGDDEIGCVESPSDDEREDYPHCCPDDAYFRCVNRDGGSVCTSHPDENDTGLSITPR